MTHEEEEWIKWTELHGWHKPSANDLIPTPKQETPPEVIEYIPIKPLTGV